MHADRILFTLLIDPVPLNNRTRQAAAVEPKRECLRHFEDAVVEQVFSVFVIVLQTTGS